MEESKKRMKTFGASRYRPSQGDELIWRDEFTRMEIAIDEMFSCKKISLEIGSGCGDFLTGFAAKNPDNTCIGCEVYKGGLIQTIKKAKEHNLENMRLFHGDARDLLDKSNDRFLDDLFVFFPDPWPKRRHNIRRIISHESVTYFLSKIKIGGRFVCATDDSHYQDWMRAAFASVGMQFTEINDEAIVLHDWYTVSKYHAKAMKAQRSSKFFLIYIV